MKRLARLFSALCLLVLVLAAGLLFYLRPPSVTPALPPISGTVERIVVDKGARQMTLIQNGQPIRRYRIALGFAPEGDKTRQGDGRTPEGIFRIAVRNDASKYHLSLGIDYPQADDIARAAAGGFDPGGDIMIHGQPNALPDASVIGRDWTAGCIAVSNAEMREIWAVTTPETIVEIRP
ncbi:MAG: L,D-transpeptidase family protein [Paracoccaceae bacterium]